MTKYPLSISPDYVSKWGFWEATRELLQNAFDQADQEPDTFVDFSYKDGVMTVGSSTGHLPIKSLLLGYSDKTDARGQFGEGLKLALLVLTRSGHSVMIANGSEVWTACLEYDETYDSKILQINVTHDHPEVPGVHVYVGGVPEESWNLIRGNVCSIKDHDAIFHDTREKGRIYVGGLYVTTLSDFQCGYAFTPKSLTLDRDRSMIHSFDASYATSRLWAVESSSLTYELLKRDAPDVKYCASLTYSDSLMPGIVYKLFDKHHPDTIPVSTQDEIQKVQSAGLRWTLVSETLKAILNIIKKFKILKSKSPKERLIYLVETNELEEKVRIELLDIIEKLP